MITLLVADVLAYILHQQIRKWVYAAPKHEMYAILLCQIDVDITKLYRSNHNHSYNSSPISSHATVTMGCQKAHTFQQLTLSRNTGSFSG